MLDHTTAAVSRPPTRPSSDLGDDLGAEDAREADGLVPQHLGPELRRDGDDDEQDARHDERRDERTCGSGAAWPRRVARRRAAVIVVEVALEGGRSCCRSRGVPRGAEGGRRTVQRTVERKCCGHHRPHAATITRGLRDRAGRYSTVTKPLTPRDDALAGLPAAAAPRPSVAAVRRPPGGIRQHGAP